MKLLVCIAFHYNPGRLVYLNQVLRNFEWYQTDTMVLIDTNQDGLESAMGKFVYHPNLEHPFHLTWMHRQHFKENIDNYDCFMYIEDDIFLSYENFLNYLENFRLVYPQYVPSFIRIEAKDRVEYISDIPRQQELKIIEIGGKKFHSFPFPINYHGFWVMPQKELKESMKDNFVRLSDGREFAAMYVGWEVGKQTLVEVENGLISKKCYSYHLSSNYALSEGPNGKIKPEDIFI